MSIKKDVQAHPFFDNDYCLPFFRHILNTIRRPIAVNTMLNTHGCSISRYKKNNKAKITQGAEARNNKSRKMVMTIGRLLLLPESIS